VVHAQLDGQPQDTDDALPFAERPAMEGSAAGQAHGAEPDPADDPVAECPGTAAGGGDLVLSHPAAIAEAGAGVPVPATGGRHPRAAVPPAAASEVPGHPV
jgi:hypothetical protein